MFQQNNHNSCPNRAETTPLRSLSITWSFPKWNTKMTDVSDMSTLPILCYSQKRHFFLEVRDFVLFNNMTTKINFSTISCQWIHWIWGKNQIKQWRIQGFPRDWGDNLSGGDANIRFCKKIPKNCMKLIEFGRGDARPKFYYVDPPLSNQNQTKGLDPRIFLVEG